MVDVPKETSHEVRKQPARQSRLDDVKSNKRFAVSTRRDPPKGWDEAPEYSSYDDVPAFRKRYVLVLCWLFFMPAAAMIALSGDVYANVDGQVVKYKSGPRLTVGILSLLMPIFGFIKLFVAK